MKYFWLALFFTSVVNAETEFTILCSENGEPDYEFQTLSSSEDYASETLFKAEETIRNIEEDPNTKCLIEENEGFETDEDYPDDSEFTLSFDD